MRLWETDTLLWVISEFDLWVESEILRGREVATFRKMMDATQSK